MSENLMEIGIRVRELREVEEISVQELSAMIDVPAAKIEAYESGTSDIPISYLTKLSSKFGVEISELITGAPPKLKMYTVCRKGKGVEVERFKEYKYNSLAFKFADKKCEPYEVTVLQADDKEPYVNSHDGHEFDFVLKGTLMMIIEDKEVILNEGDCIYLNSKYKHALKAVNGDATFLAIVLP